MSCLYVCDIRVAEKKVVLAPKTELVQYWDDNENEGYGGYVYIKEEVFPKEMVEVTLYRFFKPTATDDGFRRGNGSVNPARAGWCVCFSGHRDHTPAYGVIAYD